MRLFQGFFPGLVLLFLTSILATDSSPTRLKNLKELRDKSDVLKEKSDDVIEEIDTTLLERKADKVDQVVDGIKRKVRNKAQEVTDSIIRKHMVLSDLLMDDSLFDKVSREGGREDRDDGPLGPEEGGQEDLVLTRSLLPDAPIDNSGPLLPVEATTKGALSEDQFQGLTSDPDATVTSSTSGTTTSSVITTKSTSTPSFDANDEVSSTTLSTTSTMASSSRIATKMSSTMSTVMSTATTTISTTSSIPSVDGDLLTTLPTVANTISTTLTTSTIKAASTTIKSVQPEDLTIDEEEMEESDKAKNEDLAEDQHCHPKDVSCQSKAAKGGGGGEDSFMARSDTSAVGVKDECFDGDNDDHQHCGKVDRVMEISVDPETVVEAAGEEQDEEPTDEIESKSQSIFSLFKSFWSWF